MGKALTVRRSKTEAGKRVIPFNGDAWAAVIELRERSKLLFACEPEPEWYVLPHAEGLRNPDPTVPMSGWRTAWRNLTRMTQCPSCGQRQKPAAICSNGECKAGLSKITSPTAGLRFHDLRHHAITELAEGQASEQTIRSIAGHVSLKMLEHYSHIRLDAKRTALDALSQPGGKAGYGTNNATNEPQADNANPQVKEGIGGREGIRTPGLLVANEALSQLSYSPTSSKQILAEAKRLANRVRSGMTRKQHEMKRGAACCASQDELNSHRRARVDLACCPSAAPLPCARSHTAHAPAGWHRPPSALADRLRALP
jgi:hypothetical protein